MKKDKYTDQDIIQGIAHQDKDVLLFIYKHYYRPIKKHVENHYGSENDAEDIFQDTLIVIFNKIRNKELTLTCSFGTYLFAVAKLQWLRVLRQQKTHPIEYGECDTFFNNEPEIHEDLIQAERKKLVIRHFNEISEDCKKIIQYLINGISLIEITNLMGYSSVQHTKNRRLKCKKYLITKIMSNPRFKELTNGKVGENNQIPRW